MNDPITKDLRAERTHLLRLKAEVAEMEANTCRQLRARRVQKLYEVIARDHAWMVTHDGYTNKSDLIVWHGAPWSRQTVPPLYLELEWDSFEQRQYTASIQGIRSTSTQNFREAVQSLRDRQTSSFDWVLDNWLTLDQEATESPTPAPLPQEEARVLPQEPGAWWARWKGGEPQTFQVEGTPGDLVALYRPVDDPQWKWLMPRYKI